MAGIRRSVAVRGLVLALTGLALASLPHNYISIVLVTYGVLFWAAIPLLRAGARTLWTITLTGAAALPVVTMFLARRFPVDPADLGSHVAQTPILQDLWHPDRWDTVATLTLIGGSYPALVWLPVALAGMAAVRSGWLTRPGRMLAAGVAGMVAGYGGAWLTAGPLGLRADGQFNEMTGEVDPALPAENWHALFAPPPTRDPSPRSWAPSAWRSPCSPCAWWPCACRCVARWRRLPPRGPCPSASTSATWW